MKDHMEGFHMNKNETDAFVIHEILAIQSLAQRMRENPERVADDLQKFADDVARMYFKKDAASVGSTDGKTD